MINKDLFVQDPTSYTLPNDGVAKVTEPVLPQEWDVARYELQHFVCEGSYHEGLDRILGSYLANLAQSVQRAVWVHGFYGCGKSQLVRVLHFLWRDTRFPDGATARAITRLPQDVRDHLTELTNAGRRVGGLWSAAGTLGSGGLEDPRAALLSVILQAAGLPTTIHLAQFDLWLRREGWRDQVCQGLEARNRRYDVEIFDLGVSVALAEELLRVCPSLGASPDLLLDRLEAQFPKVETLSTPDMVRLMRQVFEQVSEKLGKTPCVLLVLDELQQYLGENLERTIIVQDALEAAVSQFGSQLLVVATGQLAMQATGPLQKLQGRFTVHVALQDKDIEQVVRQTVLLKNPSARPALQQVLDSAQGEIARHLGGTQIASQPADAAVLAADYPLLPTRRRFWERVLRAVDRGGAATQLRTHLRLAHEAARAVGMDPLACVVGGDFIFDQQKATLLQTAVLLQDVNHIIESLQDGTPEGTLKSRICALLFLIRELDSSAGVKATPEMLADLLVTDLPAGSASLRHQVPVLLQELVNAGHVTQVDSEYRVQTPEGKQWDLKYQSRRTGIKGDDGRIAIERERVLRAAVEDAVSLRTLKLAQGQSMARRTAELYFGAVAPEVVDRIPIWVRTGWDVTENAVRTEAADAGAESAIVTLFLPKRDQDLLRAEIAGQLAAREVLDTEPTPNTDAGKAARAGIEGRLASHEERIDQILDQVLSEAHVYQGGGTEVGSIGSREDVQPAVEMAARDAILRLYRRFPDGDHRDWSKVADSARKGNPDAMEAVGHKGDPMGHPVCQAVRSFVGEAGQTGTKVRQHFAAPPWGWPQDAVDAVLLVLVQASVLSAQRGPRQVPLVDLNTTSIQQTEFRAVKTVISLSQRLEIQKLLTKAGETFTKGEEAIAVSRLVQRMEQVAHDAGGAPPRPERPSTAYLLDLKGLGGNELLAQVYDRREQMAQDLADWSARCEELKHRVPRWEWLQKLLGFAESLPECPALRSEADAIVAQRLLLANPDPVPDLITRAANALRAALQAALEDYRQTLKEKLTTLQDDPTWRALPTDQQQKLRAKHGLLPPEPLQIETEPDLVSELSTTSLSAWADKTNALTEQVSRALQDAAQIMHPDRLEYKLPYRSVTGEKELEEYLEEQRHAVLALFKKTKTVVLR